MRLRANAEGEARRELDRTRAALEAKVRSPRQGSSCLGSRYAIGVCQWCLAAKRGVFARVRCLCTCERSG